MIRIIAVAAIAVASIGASASASESSPTEGSRGLAAVAQPDYAIEASLIASPSAYEIDTPETVDIAFSEYNFETAIITLEGPMRPVARPARLGHVSPPATLQGASELQCLAVAIYHEARGESQYGQKAVASVIMQRAAVPGRWGNTACKVIRPVQFSFMTSRYTYDPIREMAAWDRAVAVARFMLANGPLPELKGADHYHTVNVRPGWAGRITRVRTIEAHIFYVDPISTRALMS
jgi:spore germination cell wall hydrolase CwlJ-like protein